MPTLYHLTYCTTTNSGLFFASSVFCVSKFKVPNPNHAVTLCNILVFCRPTTNIDSHPFLAGYHYLLNIFAATRHI
jgi:hypothetical protein